MEEGHMGPWQSGQALAQQLSRQLAQQLAPLQSGRAEG